MIADKLGDGVIKSLLTFFQKCAALGGKPWLSTILKELLSFLTRVLLSSSLWVFSPSPPQPTSSVGEKVRRHPKQSIKTVMSPRDQLSVAAVRCGPAGHSDYVPWTVSGHISFHFLNSDIMHRVPARAKCEVMPMCPCPPV